MASAWAWVANDPRTTVVASAAGAAARIPTMRTRMLARRIARIPGEYSRM